MKLSTFALLAFVAACDTSMTPTPTNAPQIGKADGTDSADHACQVVLRGVALKTGGSPYVSQDGYLVWTGHVDVSQAAIDQGADVGVLYERAGRPWYEADATPTSDTHFTFDMSYGITDGNEGGTNWEDMQIELIPFIKLPDGSRVFDHNVVGDDLGSYELVYSDGTDAPFSLAADPNVCP